MHLVLGFAEKREEQCFNSAALIGPDGIEHIYRKYIYLMKKNFVLTQAILRLSSMMLMV